MKLRSLHVHAVNPKNVVPTHQRDEVVLVALEALVEEGLARLRRLVEVVALQVREAFARRHR